LAIGLTSSQRAFLRSRARLRRPDVLVGKAGLTENVLNHIRTQLARLELIKVKLPRSVGTLRRAAAEELARSLEAELVDVVGHVVVLYKPNLELPPDKRLVLPDD